MGAFKIPGVNVNQIKDTLITGGVAVGGAVLTSKAIGYLGPMIKLSPDSKWRPVVEIALGIGLGVAVGKAMKKPDLGAAFAIGPVVINGLRLVSGLMGTSVPLAGRRPRQQMGVVTPKEQFPPAWMYDTAYAGDQAAVAGAWAM